MNLDAQPWIADFRIAATLDSFPFFWVLSSGFFFFFFFQRFLRFRVGVWGVSSYFVLLTPPLSAGAGLGNEIALFWHWTRFLGFWSRFRVVPAFFVLPTPPRSVPGRGLGNRAIKLWHTTVGFSQYFVFCPADPPRSEPGAIWVIWLLRLVWHRTL